MNFHEREECGPNPSARLPVLPTTIILYSDAKRRVPLPPRGPAAAIPDPNRRLLPRRRPVPGTVARWVQRDSMAAGTGAAAGSAPSW